MLSEADVYRRRWLSIGSDSRVLLPADTAAQLAFLCRNGVSQPTHPLMRRILTDFRCLSSEITAEGLLATQKPRLSMFPLESHSQTLDEAVAHIEVNISRSTRKQVKHTCLHPRWRGVVHELGEQVDFPSSSSHSYFGSEELRGTLSPRVVRRLVRRHGRRNLKAGNVDKELPPLPPESEERTVSPRERATVNRDKIWIHRKTRILT
ncbi:hypothetical protein GYMLUDRAFT_34349 [Collybiopsis luxurians FD-317 M1]|nr:hypothetical protein GYMLUDRAFT_34349 [Collybiopsis luxurians FD-317 M1]